MNCVCESFDIASLVVDQTCRLFTAGQGAQVRRSGHRATCCDAQRHAGADSRALVAEQELCHGTVRRINIVRFCVVTCY